jgi:hypothetical protein
MSMVPYFTSIYFKRLQSCGDSLIDNPTIAHRPASRIVDCDPHMIFYEGLVKELSKCCEYINIRIMSDAIVYSNNLCKIYRIHVALKRSADESSG